jgi:hypothetical protein
VQLGEQQDLFQSAVPWRDLGLNRRYPALASLRAGLFSFAPAAL